MLGTYPLAHAVSRIGSANVTSQGQFPSGSKMTKVGRRHRDLKTYRNWWAEKVGNWCSLTGLTQRAKGSRRVRVDEASKQPLHPDKAQIKVDVILAKALYPAWVGRGVL